MAISEVKPSGPGFGSQRFLVRGRVAVPEATLVDLRPRINEYPELFPLNPVFPQPGRRGGSRAPAAVGRAGAAPGAGESEPVPEIDIYPVARPREGEFPVGGVPSSDAPNASVVNACLGDGGVSINRGIDVAAGVTTISVIGPIPRPFVVRYVEVWSGGTDAARSNIGVRLAVDNITTGGFSTSGIPIGLNFSGNVDFSGHGQMHRTYPNMRWTVTPAFIKFIVFNNTAASVFYHLVVSLEWLD